MCGILIYGCWCAVKVKEGMGGKGGKVLIKVK